MTFSAKHAFTSAVADGGDATQVRPSNWNAEHTLTMATDRLLGRDTASDGAVEEIALSTNLEFTGSGSIRVVLNPSFATLTLLERSSDPSAPAEGSSVIWQSDGTGAGDDGDIMVSITAGGVTKTTTLIDFSALP